MPAGTVAGTDGIELSAAEVPSELDGDELESEGEKSLPFQQKP